MSHHPGTPPQSSQSYQLLDLPQGNRPSNYRANASQKSQNSNQPLSPVHLNPPSNPGSPPRIPKAEKEWCSKRLSWWWVIIILSFNVGLIVSIIYLQRRSAIKNGIIDVQSSTAPIISPSNVFSIPEISLSHGLLWTTIPTWVMNVYSYMWLAMVSATALRQPFVDLNRPLNQARSARTTIMLDYRSYTAFNNWLKAFHNGHFGLCISMILSLILTFIIGPLMASLFVSAASQSLNSVPVNHTEIFNDDYFNPNASLQPSLDFASSIRTYHAQPPSWMTEKYAFAPFQLINSTTATSSNLTANTTAYSSELDCQAYSPQESNAQYSVDNLGDAAVDYSMNDRGCNISGFQTIFNGTPVYSESWAFQECPGTPYGRVGIFGGIYSDSSPIKIANYTFISCIPRYFSTTGLVTVSQATGTPNFISFNKTISTEIYPFWKQTIENGLHNYIIFNPSNNLYSDAFGFAVQQYALSQNSESPFTASLYNSSMADLFTTLVVLPSYTLLQDEAVLGKGELSTLVQRLYVRNEVAWTIIAVLLAVLVCNVWLWVYSIKRKSLLVEEPKGLLGYAGLVVGGGVQKVVEEFKRENPSEGQVRKNVKEWYKVEDSKCWFDQDDRSIQVEGLRDKRVRGNSL